MSAPIYVPAIYCCMANYHKIKYPNSYFICSTFGGWKIKDDLGNLCLIHLSAGVPGAGYPLLRCCRCLTHASSISVVLGLSLSLHGVSHPPLAIRMAVASHDMVPSGKLYCFMKAGFQEWVFHMTASRRSQFLKAWAQKLAVSLPPYSVHQNSHRAHLDSNGGNRRTLLSGKDFLILSSLWSLALSSRNIYSKDIYWASTKPLRTSYT